jgi:hypothetical protein
MVLNLGGGLVSIYQVFKVTACVYEDFFVAVKGHMVINNHVEFWKFVIYIACRKL